MADNKIDIKTLGQTGVVIDINPLEPNLPDDSLRNAQNATHDPTQAYGGALRKRPGLRRFNLKWAGGVILGGIPMPVAGTGGAPVTPNVPGVNDPTGSPAGAGDGTGAPGTTYSGGPVTYPPPGAGQFNGGTPVFGGARLIVIGRNNNQTASLHQGGVGWYVTSKKINDAATSVTTPGPPGAFAVYGGFTSIGQGPFYTEPLGRPSVYDPVSNYWFYPGAHDQTTGSLATIRKTNGGNDNLVVTIPTNNYTAAQQGGGDTTVHTAIMSMTLGADGNIYLCVVDRKLWDDSTAGVSVGRLFQLNPQTGNLTEMNLGLTQTTTPVEFDGWPLNLIWFKGVIYFSTWDMTGTANNNRNLHTDAAGGFKYVTNISSLSTSGTSSDNAGSTIGGEAVTALCVFPAASERVNDQRLFIGMGRNQAVPTFADMGSHDRSAPNTTSAITLHTPANLATDVGTAAATGNFWTDFIEFNGNLYCGFFDQNGAIQRSLIYQYVPDYTQLAVDGGWNGSGTMNLVFKNTTFGGGVTGCPFRFYVDDGVLYAIGYTGFSNPQNGNTHLILWSIDGTNWNNATTNVPQSPNSAFAQPPILMGFAQ